MLDPKSNRLRSIKQLAVVGGWFEPETGSQSRYSLHLDATFREERLGGVEDSNIHFRIRLKQCEIVVILPERGNGFTIDQRTLARTLPAPPISVANTLHQTSDREVGGVVKLDSKSPSFGIFSRGNVKSSKSNKIEDTGEQPRLNTLHSTTLDGNASWIVTTPLKFLTGALWNANEEPRFTVVDRRPNIQIEDDRLRSLPPMATVEVRCKREDLDIYDIEFKDLTRDGIRQNRQNQQIRQRAAEAFLKAEIQRQSLNVGNTFDKFSDMTLADYLVPLFE